MHVRYAVVGAALVALHLVLPAGELRDTLYLVIGASCVVAILWGVRQHRPAATGAWLLMALGQGAWVVGDSLYGEASAHSVTSADVMYFAAYPLLAIGLARLIRSRRGATSVAGLVDAAVVTLGALLLSWVFLVDPIVDDSSRTVAARVVAAAYPCGDLLLLGMLVTLLGIPGARSASYHLLAGSLVLLVLADTWYAAAPSVQPRVLDLLWLGSYVVWGLAALHPSMTHLVDVPHHRRPSLSRRRLATLAATALVAPALVLAESIHGLHVDTWMVVAGASTLSLLTMGRLALDVDELRTTARQRDALQRDLLHQASHDPVTGVLNAAAVRQVIGSSLRRGQREGTSVGVLLVGLDAFDELVDLHGPAAGEHALRRTAARLQDAVVEVEHVGRLSAELFVVCVDPVHATSDVHELATRILRSVSEPIAVGETQVALRLCVGVATSVDGGTEPDELLEQAHVALRRARASGSGSLEMFGAGVRREVQERCATEQALRHAMDHGDLELHYQPILAVQSEVVDGYEARVHWRRPGHGWQDSREFLAVAALSDLVCRIDRWSVATAVRHLATWTALDPLQFSDLTVAVTVSGRTLSSPAFVDSVTDVLQAHGVEPHRLTIGVTEMTLVDTPRAAMDLTALRDRGVFVSINEFGTGHTSITQLGSLPADIIKVDPRLVNSSDPGAQEMLALLVNVAHACGLLAVAEGVTDTERLAELRSMRYDSAQGMHSSTTDPAESGVTVVRSGSGRAHLRVVPDPDD